MNFRFLAFVLTAFFSFCDLSLAVLPSEEQKVFNEGYKNAVAIRVSLSLPEVTEDKLCTGKKLVATDCKCLAVYKITRVLSGTEEFAAREGDVIELSYPCNNLNFSVTGSTYPWGERVADGSGVDAGFRVGDLKVLGRGRWEIDNRKNLFAPVR